MVGLAEDSLPSLTEDDMKTMQKEAGDYEINEWMKKGETQNN